jgi:hypothetical protein
MFRFDDFTMQYEPYPLAIVNRALPQSIYDELMAQWPDTALFGYRADLGHKYSLSDLNNPQAYARFVRGNSTWRRFDEHIRAPEFARGVIDWLAAQHVDLGLRLHFNPLKDAIKRLIGRKVPRGDRLRTRFEFSMLPADGGHILPHTDAPGKIVTLVQSVQAPDSWSPSWGGGTDVLRPRDVRRNFNYVNRYMGFEDVEVIRTTPFVPNQCVVFVKTFNSLHSVRPMTGPKAMRRTLTINIELTS